MNGELGEPQALALWCEHLPELRVRASDGGWGPRLERTVDRVREGGSALAACERYRLLEPADGQAEGSGPVRGPVPLDPYPSTGLRPVPPVGRGSYRCPRQLCVKKGERDDQGRPPICAMFGEPMQPVS